jgi:predicted hydrocarbon binding protein
MVNTSVTACSQQVVNILVEGAQELLGIEDLQRVIDLGGNRSARGRAAQVVTPFNFADLPHGLEKQYGLASGRGLALRIGRAAFKYVLLRHGDALGLTTVDFRLQRAPRRMLEGLRILSDQIMNECGDSIAIVDGEDHWVWRSERCPICRGRSTEDPCCYLMVGLLQEFLGWAGGGRFYPVREVECRAAGDLACTYNIYKKPLD